MPTQIIERATRATPCRQFTASALLAYLLSVMFALTTAPVAAQLAMDVVTNASGTTITAHTGYMANCAALTASVPEHASRTTLLDVYNQSVCAINRRLAQVRSSPRTESVVKVDQSTMTFWGGFYYDNNVDGDSFLLEFDGRERVAYLGFDARLRDNLLTGLMVYRNEWEIDFTTFDTRGTMGSSGDYDIQVTSMSPYINWRTPDGQLELWAMAGYGEGDLELTPNDAVSSSTADVTRRMVALGGSDEISKSERAVVRLKGEVFYTRTHVDDTTSGRRAAPLGDANIDAHRARVTMEMESHYALAGGAYLKPSVDAGVRFDDQEEETGTGTEVGIGFRYTDLTLGLTVDFRGRTLIRHNRVDENFYENYYNEWDFSIGGSFQTATGTDGQGLSFSVSPSYGEIVDGGQPTWQTLLDSVGKEPRMRARVEYGLPAFGGLLTPYSEIPLGESNKIYRLGARWSLDSFLNLKLTGERQDQNNSTNQHAILLTGEMRF